MHWDISMKKYQRYGDEMMGAGLHPSRFRLGAMANIIHMLLHNNQ